MVNRDELRVLKTLPDEVADCVVISGPYYWQRDCGFKGQSGQEDTIGQYVLNLTRVFRQVRRALKQPSTTDMVQQAQDRLLLRLMRPKDEF